MSIIIQGGPIKTVHFEIPCFFLQIQTDIQNSFTRWFVKILYVYITKISISPAIRAGLTTVPFMPWHRAPVVRGPLRPPAKFSYHITFYNYGSIRVWKRIGLFYQIAPVLKKHQAFFYKRGPLIQGHKIGCPRLEHLLNFTSRYSYSLWTTSLC